MFRKSSFALLLSISTAAAPASLATQALPVPAAEGVPDADALRAVATDQAARAFYENNGWRPIWSPTAAQALEQVLAQRARHGLDRIAFLDAPLADASAAELEVARTRAALRYATALAGGVSDPNALHQVYTLPRPSPDLRAGLSDAVSGGRLGGWLESLAPGDSEYSALSQAYLRYSAAAGQGSAEAMIRPAGIIRAGDSDERVPAILEQLADSGYLGEAEHGGSAATARGGNSPTRFTEAAARAVELLQRDFGIAADGVVGPDTLKVLNLRPADRARALAVALERRRWLSRTPPATRIDVNTASARLRYYRDGEMIDSRKVIVGQPGKETPGLLAPIYRLVANPTWTVPKSIQNTELANVGSDYLASRGMTIQGGWIVQQPGPDNALGLVKFDMRNDQAIYLHDTSAPELFDRSERHLSHGCVRVEDAGGFARLLAEHEGISEAWDKASLSSETSFVPLPREIAVRLLYHNVFVSQEGRVAFRTDPYGWNDPIARALGFDAETALRPRPGAIDVGP